MSQIKQCKKQTRNEINGMSTSIDTTAVPSSTPQSTKKRKPTSETPETSKKRRKQSKVDNEILNSQDTHMSTSKKEKKKKVKAKIEELPEAQEPQDIELPDIPEQAASPELPATEEGLPIANGTGSEEAVEEIQDFDETLLQSQNPSCFYEKRLSLQLPIPAISLASSASSLLSVHLAPLLLTYFPPAEGIVLSFSDPILSAKPNYGVNLPLQPPKSGKVPRIPAAETFARCADAFGVCWVWLTATFLVFRPQPGDELKGWTNVSSEGFVGLVSYNYFQTAVGKSRIPKTWIWDGPTRESNNKKKARKGKLRDEEDISTSQTETANSQGIPYGGEVAEGVSGAFVDTDGDQIPATQTFRVVDVEMVPGHEKDRWTLQIDGSLLSSEEETEVVAQERQRFEQVNSRSRSRSKTPGTESGVMPLVGGDDPFGQQGSSL